MANALKCDRCGNFYSKEDLISSFSFTDKKWRYSIHYDAHPYPEQKIDLCPNCIKSLYFWLHNFNGENI